jgi:hypothetical protein
MIALFYSTLMFKLPKSWQYEIVIAVYQNWKYQQILLHLNTIRFHELCSAVLQFLRVNSSTDKAMVSILLEAMWRRVAG